MLSVSFSEFDSVLEKFQAQKNYFGQNFNGKNLLEIQNFSIFECAEVKKILQLKEISKNMVKFFSYKKKPGIRNFSTKYFMRVFYFLKDNFGQIFLFEDINL